MDLLLLAMIGLTGGIVAGLFGVGGGAIFAPLLILLCKFDPHVAIGTSIAIVIPTSIAAALRHHQGGMVHWKTALILAALSIVGAWVGASLSLKLDVIVLRRLFAVLLIVISLKLFFS